MTAVIVPPTVGIIILALFCIALIVIDIAANSDYYNNKKSN